MTELTGRIIPMKCPSCGAKLEVSGDMEQFTCGYCGTELMAERRGGTVALKPLVAAMEKVQANTDKTAAELAITRLQNELENLIKDKRKSERNTEANIDVMKANFNRIIHGAESAGTGARVVDKILGLICIFAVFAFLGVNGHDPYLAIFILIVIILCIGGSVFIADRRNKHKEQVVSQEKTKLMKEIADAQYALEDSQAKYDIRISAIKQKIDEKKRIADS